MLSLSAANLLSDVVQQQEADAQANARSFASTIAGLESRFAEAERSAKQDTELLQTHIAQLEATKVQLEQKEKELGIALEARQAEVVRAERNGREQQVLCEQALAEARTAKDDLRSHEMDKRMFATRLEDQVQTSAVLRTQLELAMEKEQEAAHQYEQDKEIRLLEICRLQESVNALKDKADEHHEAQQTLQAERDEAVVENFLLQQNLSGMSESYKELYHKNKYLHGKLVAIAEAGAFGGMSDEYRAALKLAKGTALEDLDMFKTASG